MIHVPTLVQNQRDFFNTHITKNLNFRLDALENLHSSIQAHEEEILLALEQDLGKGRVEAYTTEVGFVLNSISYAIKHLETWAKPERVRTPIYQMGSTATVYYEPYGTTLIIGAYNYPFQLIMEPLLGAIAAGNTAIIKPSELTPATAQIIETIINETFVSSYISVIQGDAAVVHGLLKQNFDFFFFTGSKRVGQLVAHAAIEQMAPYVLELGGKSPVIVCRDADIQKAAKRIAWGKFLAAGQTCIAPDYVYVDETIKSDFIKALYAAIQKMYTIDPIDNPDYARIINDKHFTRIMNLVDPDKVILGGYYDREKRYIGPTIMDHITWDDAVMQEEIFGPLLPILTFREPSEVLRTLQDKDAPLATYVFTESEAVADRFMHGLQFGGGCVNDVLAQVSNAQLPFGGVKASGTGRYHGFYSFETFSHQKSIVDASKKIEFDIQYPPYRNKLGFIRKILK